MRNILLALPFALVLLGCGGDWTVGSPDADGARFSRSYRYYYSQDCRYDSFGLYDCDLAVSLSPSFAVSVRVDSDGFATLNLDGEYFYYTELNYSEDCDGIGCYFQFSEGYEDLTVYKNADQMVIWDTWNNMATLYTRYLEDTCDPNFACY